MRLLITISMIFTLTTLAVGQVTVDNLITTKEQNEKWFEDIKGLNTKDKLGRIRERILLDTNVYVKHHYADRIKAQDESNSGKKTESFCRPVYVLEFNGQYLLNINNKTKNSELIKLTKNLTDEMVAEIKVINDTSVGVIYGSRGLCGVIVLSTKDKKAFERIKKIDLGID